MSGGRRRLGGLSFQNLGVIWEGVLVGRMERAGVDRQKDGQTSVREIFMPWRE